MPDHHSFLYDSATTDRRGFLGAVGVAAALALAGRIRVADAAVAPASATSSWCMVCMPMARAGRT